MQQFLKACGATQPFRLEVTHLPSGEAVRWTFPQPFVVIGRDGSADLPLDDAAVSRRHAYLQVLDGRVFCVDLASRSGVRWPDGPRPSGWLDPEAGVEIGPYRIRLAGSLADGVPSGALPEDPLTTSPSPGQGLPEVELEFRADTARAKTWLMNRRLALVGRSPSCKVQLANDAVSRVHCGLVRTADGVWVVDLLGRGGVAVNETPCRAALLSDGDRLGVAHFRIGVRIRTGSAGALVPVTPAEAALPVPARRRPAQDVMLPPSGRPADLNELVQVFLLPLASQFSRMQQQMFEQFQDAMKMAQSFSALHERQVDMIRRELERQAELTKELQSLQKELQAARSAQAPSPAPPPAPAAAAPRAASQPPAEAAPPGPATPTPRPSRSPERKAPQPAAAPAGRPGAETLPENGDVHEWLARRVDALQKERQSSWQMIKRILMGGQGGDNAL